MSLPLFYVSSLQKGTLTLDEDTSRHVVQVLRMEAGAVLALTNGLGARATARITDAHRKRCAVHVEDIRQEARHAPGMAIGISLTKNNARLEWFLEKATEMGIAAIIPLLCARTEKEKFRKERLQQILASAMLQSQQSFMPELHEPTPFEEVVHVDGYAQRFIAHCLPYERISLRGAAKEGQSALVLIGPEGDFTPEEITAAIEKGFVPVTLGDTRLRTETAGMVAAALLCVR